MTQDNNIIIGIDLGTTNSLVAFIKDGSPRIVPNERGNRMTPSVVHFKDNGEIIVGELAKNQAVLNAEKTVSNVKLDMGKPTKYQIGEHSYSPVDVSGYILKHLKSYAEKYLQRTIRNAVITVPAYFDDRQREDTLKAAEAAGLNVFKLLNEPTAAALIYGFTQKNASRLLVIDFGGGTLDITLMEYENMVFNVRGIGGSTSIGGTNFDRLIVNYILNDFETVHGIDLCKDRIAFQQLVIHAERAKIDLSSTDETRMMIPYISATEKGPIHLNMGLTVETFEMLIEPMLDQIRQHILETFEQAGLTPDWVETAFLVGGSTRVPAVEKLVRDILNEDASVVDDTATRIRREINPDEAVVRGVAVLAGILEGSVNNIEFHDITPHDLGVEDDHGEFITLLPRATTYPAQASRLFTTTKDFQKEVYIHVLQRVGIESYEIVSLGWFRLKIDETKKCGEPNIEVIFAIDTNGLLNVSAVDIESGESEAITIDKINNTGRWVSGDSFPTPSGININPNT